MKMTSPEIEQKFQALKKIDEFLNQKVDGYLAKTLYIDTYDDYKASFNGEFSTEEKVRVSEAIKMHKQMVAYKKEFGDFPKVDMFASTDWSEQIKGAALLSKGDLEIDVFGDIDDGQIMIHNKQSNSHSVVGFEFKFDENDEYCHIEMSNEGKKMFPMLAEHLKSTTLVNGGHPTSLEKNSPMDHLSIDGAWLKSALLSSKLGNEIVQEVSSETGPSHVSMNRAEMSHGQVKVPEPDSMEMGR